jgi:uncharacterized protein DUF5658
MSRLVSIDWVGHTPSRRTGELLLALWVLSIADLFFTIWAHVFTPFQEMNPIADALLGRGLIPSLIIYKLTVTLLGTAIFWRVRNHAKARFALWGLVFVYMLLAVRWSDYTNSAAAEIAREQNHDGAVAIVQS